MRRMLGLAFLLTALGIEPTYCQSVAEQLANGRVDALRAKTAGNPQTVATLNTFLGRSDLNAALVGLPKPAPKCAVGNARPQPASEWLVQHAASARVIMFNENHLVPQARVLVRALLPRLRRLGFTHIGFEALGPLRTGVTNYSAANGYYSVEPTFAALVREAQALGFTLFAYEAAVAAAADAPMVERIAAREQGEADNLARVVREAPASARFVVYAGWSHIAEVALPAGDDKFSQWMASRFKAQTGIDPLTIDLTSCAYEVSSRNGEEARVYVLEDGSASVQGMYAGAVDAQFHVPAPAPNLLYAHDFYRSTLGRAVAIPARLRPRGIEVLVEARGVGQPPLEVAFDRVVIQDGERLSVYLPPGKYELVSHRTDGTLVGRKRLGVH